MSKTVLYWRAYSVFLTTLLFACTSSGQTIRLDSFPTGLRPLGVATTLTFVNFFRLYAAVANSGDNSVSIFAVTNAPGMSLTATVSGIPSPYAVASCPSRSVLVTSPSDNSVRVLDVVQGTVVGTLQGMRQPYSAACFGPGVVSNLGDNTLVVFSPDTLTVTASIPNVPGSRGLHGITIFHLIPDSRYLAWVVGTDSNVVTVVDLSNFTVLGQIPVSRPTAVFADSSGPGGSASSVIVASAGDNSLTSYDANTLQIKQTIQSVSNPQDFVIRSGLGWFATLGGTDSVWRLDTASNTVSIIPGIPGAAAVAPAPIPSGNVIDSIKALLVTSQNSNRVFLVQQQPPPPAQFAVSNGASFGTAQAAPGSLASAFATTGVSQNFNATSVPLPKALGGVTLSVGGALNFDPTSDWKYSSTGSIQAPLLFVGPNQINFQIPPGIAPGSAVPAQLTKPDGTTLLATLNITPTAPGIFSVLQNGQGQAAALNPDYSQNGNSQSIVGAKPATRGSFIQIFATGAGDTTPLLVPGEAAPASGSPLVLTNVQPTVTIGGQAARVLFSGMAPGFVGLWQINAEVPQTVTPGPAVPLLISAGGNSSNTVTIAVQ